MIRVLTFTIRRARSPEFEECRQLLGMLYQTAPTVSVTIFPMVGTVYSRGMCVCVCVHVLKRVV
jgi:hypothetical protein